MGNKVSTHLEEVRRHLPLHQVALDMLNGTFREGLGKTETAVNSPQGPFTLPVPRGPGAGGGRSLTCEQASSSFMM